MRRWISMVLLHGPTARVKISRRRRARPGGPSDAHRRCTLALVQDDENDDDGGGCRGLALTAAALTAAAVAATGTTRARRAGSSIIMVMVITTDPQEMACYQYRGRECLIVVDPAYPATPHNPPPVTPPNQDDSQQPRQVKCIRSSVKKGTDTRENNRSGGGRAGNQSQTRGRKRVPRSSLSSKLSPALSRDEVAGAVL